MKSNYLFDYKYKKWGWILVLPSATLGLISQHVNWLKVPVFSFFHTKFLNDEPKLKLVQIIENPILDELATFGLIIGCIWIALSKEKIEDEFIAQTRLNSLVWSVYVHYGLLLLLTLFIYDINYLSVLIYAPFAFLIFFLLRFKYTLYKNKKQIGDEE